jgi:hypothetical protein
MSIRGKQLPSSQRRGRGGSAAGRGLGFDSGCNRRFRGDSPPPAPPLRGGELDSPFCIPISADRVSTRPHAARAQYRALKSGLCPPSRWALGRRRRGGCCR